MKISKLLILALLVLDLCACHQDASVELVKQLEERNIPIALKWVEENIEGAKEIKADLEYGGAYRMFYEMCNGTYLKDGNRYYYLINTDTLEFASNEYYDKLTEKEKELITLNLPQSIEYRSINIVTGDETMSCNYVMDTDYMGKLDELKFEETSYPLYKMTGLYDLKNIDEYAKKMLKEIPVTIELAVDDLDCVIEQLKDLEYLCSRENWNFEFFTEGSEEKVSCYKGDHEYYMVHNYKRADNEYVSQIVAQR